MCRQCFIIFIVLIIFMPEEYGQTTSSPYSMFAQGQIENLGAGTNRALGGTGLAFKSHRYLNNMNPASYSGIDSLSFVFEAGVTGRYTRYITNNQKQTKYNANLNHIALGFRICRWWATSIGVTPYSSVGYKINTTDMVEGDLSYYLKTYEGSGGINKFYFGNSFRPYKNLSVGVHVSYILGTITQTETGSTIDQYITYIIKEVSRINSYYIDYGAQYTIKHNGWNYSLGAVFGNNKELHVSNEMYIMYSDDSLKLTPEKHKFIIPLKYGFGLALEKMEKLKVGIDYEKRNWSANNRFSNPLLKTRDSERFSAGIEYCPYKSRRDQGFKKVYYRLGVNYNKTYLIIRNEAINSMAISFGFGIPIKREHSMINLAFEFGSLGTTSNELIKENYALMYINFTMLDIWFQKSRFN